MLDNAPFRLRVALLFKRAKYALAYALRSNGNSNFNGPSSSSFDVDCMEPCVVKPGMPILLPCALACWAGCATAYTVFEKLSIEVISQISIVALSAVVICCVLSFLLKAKALYLGIASIALGVFLGACGAMSVHMSGTNVPEGEQQWSFELLEDVRSGDYGSSAFAVAISEDGFKTKCKVNFADNAMLMHGTHLIANTTMKRPKAQSVDYFWSRGAACTCNIKEFNVLADNGIIGAIGSLRTHAINAFEEHAGTQAGILQALVCGYRNTIQESGEYNDYKSCGLAHIVAVSGAHLAIVTMLFGWLLRKLKTPLNVSILATLFFVFLYIVFAGLPISAVRAAFMVLLSTTCVLAKRRNASLSALALCIFLFIAFDPVTAVSVSFALSVGSTLGIIMFASLISSWFSSTSKAFGKYIGEPIGLTLSSNIATQPFSMALFSQFPIISPTANLIVAPLFSLGCIIGLLSAVVSCAIPNFAGVAIGFAAFCTFPLTHTVNFLAQVPYSCIAVCLPVVPMIVLSVFLCSALWIAWPSFSLRILVGSASAISLAMALLLLVVPNFYVDEIRMLNVGQGDSFLIRSKGASVLIDTGNNENMLREALAKAGVVKLDAVVVTHSDSDHCGELASLAGYVSIDNIYSFNDACYCSCSGCAELRRSSEIACDSGLSGLSLGDVLDVGSHKLKVIWPYEYVDEGGNADSLCLLMETDADGDGKSDWKSVFLGDAENDQLKRMISNGQLSKVDVLKVGHHGSKNSLSEEVICAIEPEIALISAGENNRYGHPSEIALQHLESVNAKVLRTDELGDVSITFEKDKMNVS